MVLFYQSCKNAFTTVVTGPGRNIFASLSYGYTTNAMGFSSSTTSAFGRGATAPFNPNGAFAVQVGLTEGQRNMVQQVHDMYSLMLASRHYDKIPSNYEQYLDLLSNLQTIAVPTSTLALLVNIVEKTLIGCMNIVQIYESATYNELQILLLNNRIDDILNNKNNKNVIADEANIQGQFSATQTFKLSKFYSYYIYLYGMPEFGVGFDPAKLTFLKKALELFDQTHIPVPSTLPIPPTDTSNNAAGAPQLGPTVAPPAPPANVYPISYQESIFEMGYAVNIYDHLMEYQTIYPLGFYIVAMLAVPPPPEVPAAALNPDPTGILTISYLSEQLGMGGLDSSGGLPVDACFNTLQFAGTDDQLALVTSHLSEVQNYMLGALLPGRPILSHNLIPGGADVFTSRYASYTFYYSTPESVKTAFSATQAVYGGQLSTFTFQEYNMESKEFTVMDNCGNVYVQKFYQGVV